MLEIISVSYTHLCNKGLKDVKDIVLVFKHKHKSYDICTESKCLKYSNTFFIKHNEGTISIYITRSKHRIAETKDCSL